MGVLGLRALEPRGAAAARRRGRGDRARRGLDRRRPRPRPVLPLPRSRRSRLRALLRVRALRRARAPRAPRTRTCPGRYTGRGCAIKRLDHINLLAADVRANREFCVDALAYRLYERIELDDGSEAGAWMSATIAAHELIYTRDAHGANGRLHHVALWVDTREECLRAADIWVDAGVADRGRAVQARDRPGLLPVRHRARRQPHRGHHRRPLRLRARRAGRRLDRGRAREGPGLGRQDRRVLPHLRHAARRIATQPRRERRSGSRRC